MAGLIGKKIGMTSLYDDKGNNLACTVIQAGPCVVTQIKNIDLFFSYMWFQILRPHFANFGEYFFIAILLSPSKFWYKCIR